MNVTIFGANGAIGTLLVDHFLNNGDTVNAYVRRMGSIEKTHDNLTVMVGGLSNQPLIEKTIVGADAVISALGPALDMARKIKGSPIADGHEKIIASMEKLKKRRLITLGTPSIRSDDDSMQFWTIVPAIMARILYPNGYLEMTKIERLIKMTSLDWTVVRIINPNAAHKNSGYSVSLGNTPVKAAVSRENIAAFIYSIATKKSYVRKMPIVFNKRSCANKANSADAKSRAAD